MRRFLLNIGMELETDTARQAGSSRVASYNIRINKKNKTGGRLSRWLEPLPEGSPSSDWV